MTRSMHVCMKTISGISIFLLLSACASSETESAAGPKPKAASADTEFTKTLESEGEKAAARLVTELKAKLQKALRSGSPASALEVCSVKAQQLSKEISSEMGPGVRVRRTSLRVRNPENAPTKADKRILRRLKNRSKTREHSTAPYIAQDSQNPSFYRYYKPIFVQPPCLNCHGDRSKFSSALKHRLESLYPRDRAVGYSVGDFRGAVVVEMDWGVSFRRNY